MILDMMVSTELVNTAALDRLETIRKNEIEEAQKDIHVSRGFREDDIFWENIGMHTLKRFYLRLFTLLVSVVASLITMGVFESLFYF